MANSINSVLGYPNAELNSVTKRIIYDVRITDIHLKEVYFQMDKDNLMALCTAIESELQWP